MTSFDPAKSAYSRVFLIEGRAQPDHEPIYQSCLKAGSLSKSFGSVEPIPCPSPTEYGKFDEVGRIQGAEERASTSLAGRYAADLASELLRIGDLRCAVDIQAHFGACTDPRVFNTFTKAIVMEDVFLESWATEDLGALSGDENAPVGESTDVSIGKIYEVLALRFQERAPDLIVNEVVDVVICDRVSCGECDVYSEGCEKIYALVGGIVGSPGTPPDIAFSLDKGKTWALDEINSLAAGETADALACLLDYLVVVSAASAGATGSLQWKDRATVDAGTLLGWTENLTGFVAGGAPSDIWSVGVGAFICGAGGHLYWTPDPTQGVVELDAGVAAVGNALYAIHALDSEFAVAVGDGDTIVFTENRVNWIAASPTGSGDGLVAVWIKSKDEWWVGTDAGQVFYTLDRGATWTEKVLPGVNVTRIDDIQLATDSVVYVCGNTGTAPNTVGRMWRSYNDGHSFVMLPEGTGNLPTNISLAALAACVNDPNFVVGVGVKDATEDGIIIVGED